MAPPKPTSIPSARPTGTPGKTALSSGTRGLKFMQRGAAAKPSATTPSTSSSTTTPAATPAAPAAPSEPPKKVKGWLGVPQAEAESQWVLPSGSSGGVHESEAWGDVSSAAGDDGKLEVEDSYLPFVLGAGKSAAALGGGKGGRWSYGGLNRDVEKLSATPASLSAEPSSSSTKPFSAQASADADPQPKASTSKSAAAPTLTEGGFMRPAEFATHSDEDEEEVAAVLDGSARSTINGKGKGKSSSSPSSAPAQVPKAKYPQGARRQHQVPSSSSYNSLTQQGQQRGKKRPSSDAFDGARGGGGSLLSGLELGDSSSGPTSSGAAAFGDGGGSGGGAKKGRYVYDNGARKEAGLDAVGRKKGGGGSGRKNK